MNKISILIPTKNRVHNIESVLNSLNETVSKQRLDEKMLEVVFYVDSDDENTLAFLVSNQSIFNIPLVWNSGKNVLFSDMWNKAYERCSGDIVMLCGDDVEFKTKDWDILIEQQFEAIPDKICYITVRDGFQNGALGVHGFVHRKWVETIGFFTPPYFVYWYADSWVDEVSKMINRYIYLDNIEVIHYHPATDNSRGTDDVYKYNDAKITKELINSYEAKLGERQENARLLQQYIENFNKSKPTTDILLPEKQITKKLSILVCSIFERKNMFDQLMMELRRQVKSCPNDVEILYEIDGGLIPTGTKRNELLRRSCGEYVVSIDDDDTVNESYVELILNAIEGRPDCVGFRGRIFWEKDWFIFHNSIQNQTWSCDKEKKVMFDNVSHINPIKRSIATSQLFPDKFWGEDNGWLSGIRAKIKTEKFIFSLMYHYTPSQQDVQKQQKDLK